MYDKWSFIIFNHIVHTKRWNEDSFNVIDSFNEVGVFTMTDKGMVDVSNPSELFMSDAVIKEGLEGSAVAIILEGTRLIYLSI